MGKYVSLKEAFANMQKHPVEEAQRNLLKEIRKEKNKHVRGQNYPLARIWKDYEEKVEEAYNYMVKGLSLYKQDPQPIKAEDDSLS